MQNYRPGSHSVYDLKCHVARCTKYRKPALREQVGSTVRTAASLCHATVRLPLVGSADSLNVAVATGVMLYELVRRFGAPA